MSHRYSRETWFGAKWKELKFFVTHGWRPRRDQISTTAYEAAVSEGDQPSARGSRRVTV